MKTFVIAQHHGSFFTIKSLVDCGLTDITAIIPGSQVIKYNKMYSENEYNPDYSAFKDYDKALAAYAKQLDSNIKVYVVDDFDVTKPVCSTLRVIKDLGCNEIVACMMSGVIAIKDYTVEAKDALQFKEFGLCMSRVYQNNSQLSMYHMLGLPSSDKSLDVNFFLADISKIRDESLYNGDSKLLNDATTRKQITLLPREYNGKDDVLIGQAISARQTLAHNLAIQSGYVVNLWNKLIKVNHQLVSEEIYGYPFHFYSKYAEELKNYLPMSTISRIITNGKETEKCISGLDQCLDIIDL